MKILWDDNTLGLKTRQNQNRRFSLIKLLQKLKIQMIKNKINGIENVDTILLEEYESIFLKNIKSSFTIYIKDDALYAKETILIKNC